MVPDSTTNAYADTLLLSNRRNLLRNAGIGAALAGAATLGLEGRAEAQSSPLTDADILNFALNLEYLEAEYYLMATYGRGLTNADSTGADGAPGYVNGGAKVSFTNKTIQDFAFEIADDEYNHVKFLRAALGNAAVARPAIDLNASFTTLARAAGVVGPNGTFNPFLNELDFLIGAFIFEDVGVTAYLGAAASIMDKSYLTAAGGILAVEAYHASSIRLQLFQQGLKGPANKISALRATLSAAVVAGGGDDAGITDGGKLTIVPTDSNSIAYARTPAQVLNIVYGGGSSSGYLFFPDKMNGTIK